MNVQAGELAVVVKGLWPNVGRVVYVDRLVSTWDFTPLGLGQQPGWRVRTWSHASLETTAGPSMVGYTPLGSLRPLGPLTPDMASQIAKEMALADFREAVDELADILRKHGRAHRRQGRTKRKHCRDADNGPVQLCLLPDTFI